MSLKVLYAGRMEVARAVIVPTLLAYRLLVSLYIRCSGDMPVMYKKVDFFKSLYSIQNLYALI